MDIAILILQILFLLGMIALVLFGKSFFPKYLERKADNLATKEDIAGITREVESVKSTFQKANNISDVHYEIKHKTYLKSLEIVDAVLCQHPYTTGIPGRFVLPSKQYATIEEVRKCHSELILVCDDYALVDQYVSIVAHDSEGPDRNLLNKVAIYRNMVRKELGFGSEFSYGPTTALYIFGSITDPKNTVQFVDAASQPINTISTNQNNGISS